MADTVNWSVAYADSTGLLTLTYASGGYSAVTFDVDRLVVEPHPTYGAYVRLYVGSPDSSTNVKAKLCTSPTFGGSRDTLVARIKALYAKIPAAFETDTSGNVTVERVTFADGAIVAAGSVSGINNLTVSGSIGSPTRIVFNDQASAPTGASGVLYYDDGTNTVDLTPMLRVYNASKFLTVPSMDTGIATGGVLSDGTNSFNMTQSRNFWTRIGNRVSCNMDYAWDSKGSASGTITIRTALPYDATDNSPMNWVGVLGAADGLIMGGSVKMGIQIGNNSGIVSLITMDQASDTALGFAQDTNFAGTGALRFFISYLTDEAW